MEIVKEFEYRNNSDRVWGKKWSDGSYEFKTVGMYPFERSVIEEMKEDGFIDSFNFQENLNSETTFYIDGIEYEISDSSWHCNLDHQMELIPVK